MNILDENDAYEFSDDFIDVTIPFDKAGFTDSEFRVSVTSTRKVPENIENKLIELLKSNSKISRSDLAVVLKLPETTIRYYLNKMKNKGLIIRVGSDKGGHWEIKDKD